MIQISKILLLIGALLMNLTNIICQQLPETYTEAKYGKLEYGFFIPENLDESKTYPLVMYLHGWSNDYTVYLEWYNEDMQAKNPCFVFTPKTPTTWADWSGWNDFNLSEPMQAAMHVMDSLTEVYPIDKNRLYVYGISMGGEGVFDLFDKLPGKFAAGMSICGGGQAWWADNIAKTPFWMFHGSADQINPPEITERVYNKLVEIGGTKMRYTNYPGYGHEIWDIAQNEPSFYDWMFSFSKNDTSCGKPNKSIELTGSVADKIQLEWNNIRSKTEKANKIWYYDIYNSEGIIETTEFDQTSFNFSPIMSQDTFKIKAVNYCFAESEFSNALYYNGTNLTPLSSAVLEKKKINLVKINDNIYVNGLDENEEHVEVKVFGLDGKLLYTNNFNAPNNIVLDCRKIDSNIFLVNIEHSNIRFSKLFII